MQYKGDTENRHVLIPGRFMPFHNGHKWMVDQILNTGRKVCIALMDIKRDKNNPYSLAEREEMISLVYKKEIKKGAVKIIAIPPISSINVGRTTGFKLVKMNPPKRIFDISATKARNGDHSNLPKEIQKCMKNKQ